MARLAVFACAALIAPAASVHAEPVDLELVLAVDPPGRR
jgi:hypothetical protein